ncbi:hypothetical protein D3C80_562550 [compost metagenome]
MDMANATHVFLRDADGIAAAEQAMAGIEQQVSLRPRVFHQQVDLLFALHHRSHVVVINEGDALFGGKGGQRFDTGTERRPVLGRKARTVDQRLPVIAVDGVGGFADDDDLRAHGLQEIKRRLHRLLFGFDVVGQKVQRMPAGDEGKATRRKHALQAFRVGRELVALLDAVEADLGGFIKALFEADMRTQRAVVVVGPGNRVGSVTDHLTVFP